MLSSLSIRNFVLIDSQDAELLPGLVAITGETGSGKSIILSALSCLLGAKAEKGAIRSGESSAEITGLFITKREEVLSFLREHEIEEDGEIILRRIIKENGRSSLFLNGVQLGKKEQEELSPLLSDFSSQNSHLSLMREDYQRRLLDRASSTLDMLSDYQKAYDEYIQLKDEIESLKAKSERERESLDYAEFCLNELDSANLTLTEDQELEREIRLISESEFLSAAVRSAVESLDDALSKASTSFSSLLKAEKKDESLSILIERLESLQIEGEDIKESLSEYLRGISFSEWELEEKNERLSQLQKIKRKYGGSIEKAIEKREAFREEIGLSSNIEERIASLEKRRDEKKSEAETLSEEISKKRKTGAASLSKRITENLRMLGMESALFNIEVEKGETLTRNGSDKIRYLISPNRGEKTNEIQNIASGGELSRIMLSIKAALDIEGEVETLIFDEIDAGLGGKAANNVAQMLKKLSENHQVIVITHLAQIASKADQHLVVSKREENGRTLSSLRSVEGKEREIEIARLLSGDESTLSIEHAKSLLEV